MAQPYMKKDDDEEEGDPPLLPPPPHKPYPRSSRCLLPGTIREQLPALACRIWRDLASCLLADSVVASSGVRIMTMLCWSGRGDRSRDLAGNWGGRARSYLDLECLPSRYRATLVHLIGRAVLLRVAVSESHLREGDALTHSPEPFFFSALELHVQYFRLDP